jgi:p-cumate 2,3-dioxygenase subunit alpha
MGTAFAPAPTEAGPWIREQREQGIFKVARRVFTDPRILDQERKVIFDRCWLYLGHNSELKQPNDYLTRSVGGRELIFNRDRNGVFHAFFNTCPHRGAMVAREKCGKALGFKCFYHGWAFNNNGQYANLMPGGVYPQGFGKDGQVDLTPVPRLDEYRGFYFINYDRDAVNLAEYLAGTKEIFDIVADHGPHGMEIVGGVQEYGIRANWKLLVENSIDGYHAAETHSSYFEYLLGTVGATVTDDLKGIRTASQSLDLGNGHAVIEGKGPWGRPVGRAVPAWGAQGKADVEAIVAELVERVGPERAVRIANGDRNMGIFPNLVINDIMAVTVRTFYPVAPGEMLVNSWALAPVGELPQLRKRRLDNFLEFLGPGGFATPDDVEALESAQRGYANAAFAPWNDMSRGMLKKDPGGDDEAQMRCFWREWNRRVTESE